MSKTTAEGPMKLSEKIRKREPAFPPAMMVVSSMTLESWAKDAEELEQAQTWIPVSERLPETNEGDSIIAKSARVLACDASGFIRVTRLERWLEDGAMDWVDMTNVVGWMPLPPSLHP